MANMPSFRVIYRTAGVRPQAAASRMDALSHPPSAFALRSSSFGGRGRSLSHARQVAPCANSRHTTPPGQDSAIPRRDFARVLQVRLPL